MSTTSLPSYSAEPHQYEERIALVERQRPRLTGDFFKKSKNGDARLQLTAQESNATLPTYGSQACIAGVIELFKTENVISVEVKVEGRLRLREIAEGGTTTTKLCLNSAVLWNRGVTDLICAPNVPFSLTLPPVFRYENRTYPLPPTFDVKLSGVPGFTATIDYSVTATITKQQQFTAPSRLTKSNILGGAITLSTPFIYLPRTRPAVPIPPRLRHRNGFIESPDWACYQSEIRGKTGSQHSILSKLYLPASHIFCMSKPIPFHLTFEASAQVLTLFLPHFPSVSSFVKVKQTTRIQLMRQSTVDVRNEIVAGTKTDIWRVDCIGEGSFRHAGNGPTWTSYSGEINMSNSIRVSGFKVSGLSVKDCILLFMTPPDRSPFAEFRQVVPVRLTTDPYSADGSGIGARRFSVESTDEETLHG